MKQGASARHDIKTFLSENPNPCPKEFRVKSTRYASGRIAFTLLPEVLISNEKRSAFELWLMAFLKYLSLQGIIKLRPLNKNNVSRQDTDSAL